jgi:hypothetical protein
MSPQYKSPPDIDTMSAGSHISPQLLHAEVPSISDPTSSPPGLAMIWTSRPSSLPGPELLRHLYVHYSYPPASHCTIYRVDVFFKFHPHAGRLFHATSFMSSLSLPPTHPRFPSIPVLHAICAIGSFYTAAVTSPPLPDFNEVSPGTYSSQVSFIFKLFTVSEEIFLERIRIKEQRTDSFAEEQAKLARESAERLNLLGKDLFHVFQGMELLIYSFWLALLFGLLTVLAANVILTWFYWSLGR